MRLKLGPITILGSAAISLMVGAALTLVVASDISASEPPPIPPNLPELQDSPQTAAPSTERSIDKSLTQWSTSSNDGAVYTYRDGGRTVRLVLEDDLLETISKWQVAIGDGTTGVRTQAVAIRCSSTPFCRSVPEQHGTWRAMLESVPQPTGAQDTACAQNRPTSPRRCVGCVADSRVWRRLDDPKDCHTPCPSTGAVGHPR